MNLYKVVNKLGEWWVVDKDPTSAQDQVIDYLNGIKYGIPADRKVYKIELISSVVDKTTFKDDCFLLTY